MKKTSKSFGDYFKDPVVKSFGIKSVIFIGIIFLLRTFLLYFSYTEFFRSHFGVSAVYRLPFLTGLNFGRFLNAIIFTAVIGVLLLSRKIQLLKYKKQSKRELIEFLILFIAYFCLYYIYLYWLKGVVPSQGMIPVYMIIRYLLQLTYLAFLAIAIFGCDFLVQFVRKFYKEILILITVLVSYSFLILIFENLWFLLSSLVTRIVGFFLGLTEGPISMDFSDSTGPRLQARDFRVGISSACSGIDSLQLFISIYAFLFFMDWKILNKKRMAFLFLPGLLGTFLYNNIRIYLLMLVALYIDRNFAINTFHTNAGWIFFLVFFFIFWHFGSSWVYEKEKKDDIPKPKGKRKEKPKKK